jgi:hypothetical protein
MRVAGNPVVPPPVEPPVSDPPAFEPPVSDPPLLEPPVSDPPLLEPPVSDPPLLDPLDASPASPPLLDPPPLPPPFAEPPELAPAHSSPSQSFGVKLGPEQAPRQATQITTIARTIDHVSHVPLKLAEQALRALDLCGGGGSRRVQTKVDLPRRSKLGEWNAAPGSLELNKESSDDS